VTETAAFVAIGEGASLRLVERGEDLFFANGGERCYAAEAPDVASALALLDPVEDFSLLVTPGIADPAAAAWCEARRDCFYVADPPAGTAPGAVATFPSPNAALYYPWLVDADGATVPPSRAVAGVYARTPVWKAPVGPLAGVEGVEREVGAREQERLNAAGVNLVRRFTERGINVWGARTMAPAAEWKYVPVRRLFIFLERSIDAGTQWAVFEPNDEPLWAELRRRVGDFLFGQWRAGALQGSRPEEAYFVRCGRDTMTQNDIDSGRIVILVGFAPARPAEFVIFRVQQLSCAAQRS